jgi:hypothetical protein
MQKSWIEGLQSIAGLEGRLADVGMIPLAGLLMVSLLTSLLMSWLYVIFYESRGTGTQIHRAFPLIGVSVTAIFLAVQFSLPLSLGLLGALSIVRFRTAIKEPEEIGFVLLVVATSLCVATFSLVFLLLVVAVAIIGLVLLRIGKGPLRPRHRPGVVVVSLPAAEYAAHGDRLVGLLAEAFSQDHFESITNRGDHAAITYRFAARDREKAIALQRQVQAICSAAQTTVYAGDALS